jgi:DNA-binding LytR/AlgR family response regulator
MVKLITRFFAIVRRMIKPFRHLIGLLIISGFCQNVLALQLVPIEFDQVIVCPVLGSDSLSVDTPPTFNETNCKTINAQQVNPQDNALWVKAFINIPPSMRDDNQPHSIYVSGKTSSEVYFNGHYLGHNGTPSRLPEDEFVGKIDAMFYVPAALIKDNDNQIILKLSSHHGFLTLGSPINFVGFGDYADPSYFIQRNLGVSLIPLGALIIGVLYFLVASFSPHQRPTNLLFLLMSTLAACQLFAEISRGLFSYDYPFHDVRLLLIVCLSVGFGTGLLSYITLKLELLNKWVWIISGASLTLFGVIATAGFDAKTAMAILIPSALSTILVAVKAFKTRDKEHFIYLSIFLALTITVVLTLANFHDILFYYIITAVLGFLFIQQALKLNREQEQRRVEQLQIEKLKFKLEQNQRKHQLTKIKINSAGKIELVASDEIAYCKASGDYVEIYLQDKKQILFSGNLKELENQLPSSFLRVHRSYLVNLDFIRSLNNNSRNNQVPSTGGGFLLLDGDLEVPVSRRIMPMVRSVINEN